MAFKTALPGYPVASPCYILLPQLFVAELQENSVGQEFLLFSWKLVLCDLALAFYLLFISFFILLLGQDVTTNVVETALFK